MELRALDASDLDAFYRITAQKEVARYMRFDAPENREAALCLLEEYLACGAMAILEEGKLAGVYAEKPQPGEAGVYSLSLFLDTPYWGRGIATRLLAQRTLWAKQAGNARAFEAYVVSQNEGSRRALEKNGYVVARRLTFDDLEGELLVYRQTF